MVNDREFVDPIAAFGHGHNRLSRQIIANHSTTDLVALNAPTGPTSPDSRIVSGPVFEITSNGRQPVRNVWVGYGATGSDAAFAETRTDAAGHYRLCGLPKEEQISLVAVPAYLSLFYASAGPGSDAILDIEVKRK